MADFGRCFAYLCGWCYCFKTSEPGAEENQLGNASSNRHPKEQQVDDEFRAKNYVQDKSGRFQRTTNSNEQLQPTLPPLPELRPLEPLEPFKDMTRPAESGNALAVNGGAANAEEASGPGTAKLIS